jgi:transposase
MSQTLNTSIAVVGIDIGKNSFHLAGQDQRGTIVLRQKWSRVQVEARLANLPPCLIGMEACVGANHLSRKLQMLGQTFGRTRRDRRTTFATPKQSLRRCNARP